MQQRDGATDPLSLVALAGWLARLLRHDEKITVGVGQARVAHACAGGEHVNCVAILAAGAAAAGVIAPWLCARANKPAATAESPHGGLCRDS